MMVTLLYQSERVRFGAAGSLMLMQYRLPPTLEELKRLEVYEDQLLLESPKISVLTLSERTNTLLRVPVAEKGLAAAMVRTFLSGFLLLTRGALNLRSFSAMSDAVAWLRELPGQDPTLKVELSRVDLERFFATPFPRPS